MTPQELVDLITTRAHATYAEGTAATEHMAMAFIDSDKGLTVVMFDGFGDLASKQALRVAFEAAARGGAQCLGMVHEGWTASRRSPTGWLKDLPPDDRMEVLMIYAAAATDHRYVQYRIRRGRERATLERLDATIHESRWFSNLPWKTS